ncbi:hypothetical protein WJX84_007094 [Apatococcus fuscideae]|uniref:Uncharacterized protein n=1 Tax=Apatococcus fuscideae TaxID=2026836 RepID=A0AAW1SMK7_9CHLO
MEPAVSLCRAVKAGRAPSQAEAGCRPSGDQFLRKAAASFLLSAPPKSSLVLLSGDAGFKGRAEQAKPDGKVVVNVTIQHGTSIHVSAIQGRVCVEISNKA